VPQKQQSTRHTHNLTGAAIPFGRSLTYRFAFAGFWAAAAYANVDFPPPLNPPGAIKGLLLRHLRWWSSKPDIFNVDGTLNIGFAYPNMYMCEDYNSPQSAYWGMKSLITLALPASHPFWSEQESQLHPSATPLAKAVHPPMQILCNSGSHHFLLSSGQFCAWPLKATEAKYGKFAYSSALGFSVPTGPLLQQMAPDSTLALSIDDGENWKVRWKPLSPKWSKAWLRTGDQAEELPVLVSGWRPWTNLDTTVVTALIPPSSRWPDWHVRIHQLFISSSPPGVATITAVEGGFAINGRNASDGRPIAVAAQAGGLSAFTAVSVDGPLEHVLETPDACCIFSTSGASGIRQLAMDDPLSVAQQVHGTLLKPDSNTNLIQQRTAIPTLRSQIAIGQPASDINYKMTAAVFATTQSSLTTMAKWADPPVIQRGKVLDADAPAYIEFNEW
jgi:hypothetical protein